MILRFEMLSSVVSYERKNISFYEKNFKLTKNNTFDVFCNRSLHKLWLIFSGKILFRTHTPNLKLSILFPILKVKFSVAEIVKRIF